MDIQIEDISQGRVRSALDHLTCVWGGERKDTSFITPLQAMIGFQDLEVDDIAQISNAAADRLRCRRGFKDGAFVADGHTHRRGPRDAAFVADHRNHRGSQDGGWHIHLSLMAVTAMTQQGGAFDARAEEHGTILLMPVPPEQARHEPPAEDPAGTDDRANCWVRPLRHTVPTSKNRFEDARTAMGLNRSQAKALFLTREHRLVLARGPPGTGKTQLVAAALHTWAQAVPRDAAVFAASPSNAATDNLLDRLAM